MTSTNDTITPVFASEGDWQRGGSPAIWIESRPYRLINLNSGDGTVRHGNRVTLWQCAEPHSYPPIHTRLASRDIPALSRYEPQTRNHGGSLGAYRDVIDEAGINAAVAELRESAER